MEHCAGGDMFDFMMDKAKQTKCLHTIVYDLASTLHELHQNDVYLTDIKPENVFIGDVFKFGDIECAFMDRRFLTEEEVRDKQCIKDFTKKRWVRTSQYLPDKVYPLTRRIAVRNDVYALFMTIGAFISNKYFGVSLKVFCGKDDLTLPLSPLWINELKEEAPQLLDHPYIKTILNHLYKPNCITETTLLDVAKMAYINKLRAE
jgi:serine/threonine protein kinase